MNNRLIGFLASGLLLALLAVLPAMAQPRGGGSEARRGKTEVDSTKVVPRGLKTWRVDERFGSVTPTEPDTMPHLFQQINLTDGIRGEYNHTGNLASPRISRIYNGQQDYMMGAQFIFARPYDMAIGSVSDCVYTNTKAPITNLSWMAQGNRIEGDDRIRALFATNMSKNAGAGFKVDYFYGQGYYQHQSAVSVAAKLFGSYRGERYQMHTTYVLDRTKNAENGGLSDDRYITHPEYESTAYNPTDMPVRLSTAYNTLKVNTLFLTHRYNMGYYSLVDSLGQRIAEPDSLSNDSTVVRGMRKFTSVASIIHTAKYDHNRRFFIDTRPTPDYYITDIFATGDTINDQTRYLSLENTLALEMNEGFRKWVKTGMRLFAKHQYASFTLPNENQKMVATNFNYITVGAQLMKEKGRLFRYNVLGEMRTTGANWGEFNVEGNAAFNIPVRRDSIGIGVEGFVRNEEPAFYYQHYHANNAWWDSDLTKVFRGRVQGTLSWRKTQLRVAFETIQNHTFFQEQQDWTLQDAQRETDPTSTDVSLVKYGVGVAQANKNIQILSAALRQDFKFGPLVWENELTYQQTSDDKVLPLPIFNGWSNLYFNFRLAKVLRVDLGGDIRYFTRYYAPTYSPIIGQYAVQDSEHRMKIGNYPWVNVYANFHLKTCRFYLMMTHVNCTAGNYFLVPHQPTTERVFRFGISWNFFN